MTDNSAVFTILFLVASAIFVWSCYRRFSLLSLGQPENRLHNARLQTMQMLRDAFGQRRVLSKGFGLNHGAIFWAFLLLLIANADFVLSAIFPGVSLKLLPLPIRGPLFFSFDLASLLALVGVTVAAGRRLFFKPDYLDTPYVRGRSAEAFIILGLIALLMLAYFAIQGADLAMGRGTAPGFMPVSRLVAGVFAAAGPATLDLVHSIAWLVHAVVLLAFICFLPMSKHLHILTAIPNCLFQGHGTPLLNRETFIKGNRFGVGQIDQYTWKDLLDGFACTECGRCQNACPATATGKPLNPRQVVHAMKMNLLANGPRLKTGQPPLVPLIGEEGEGTNTEETIWSCTTCGACLQACPVMIEQMPKIIKMRRHLVQMESTFPEELLNLFENMEQRSNPWGIAPTERTKWSATLQVQPFEAGTTEYLFYIGCAGTFDSRAKHTTVALATILDRAGISWGVLGREERCCGDSVRRLGNEYLFEKMAEENVRLFREKRVTKVITQCPHCFTTLKNDYRQYGLELEVLHHTELIDSLLQSGRLQLDHQVTELGTVVVHDSCYLGRHNGIYQSPRSVVTAVTGQAPEELPRTKSESFCCGAGGGRMWLEEFVGERINRNRVSEALEGKADTICVACPYCMTMFEDGLKDQPEAQARVKDLAELVAEGLRSVACSGS